MELQKCNLNLGRNRKELKPHGTIAFPCAGFSEIYEKNTEVAWHWHEEIEIVYVEWGSMDWQVPGKIYHLKEGSLFAVNSGILHHASAKTRCRLNTFVFHRYFITGSDQSVFDEKYIRPLTECCSFDGCLMNDLQTDTLLLCRTYREALSAYVSGEDGHEFMIREKLSEICMELYRHFRPKQAQTVWNADIERIQKMLYYIQEHYMENIALAQIAGAADIGERECLRCFKRCIQTSPIQYLLKYRVMRAAAMLREDRAKSIAEISNACGFESPSNFAQTFKKYFLCTPKKYRLDNDPRLNCIIPAQMQESFQVQGKAACSFCR